MVKTPGKNAQAGGNSRSETSELAQRIARARGRRLDGEGTSPAQNSGKMAGMGRAARLGTEFIAAVLVGAGMGFIIDRVAGTEPWFMLVMLLMGFGAGILNVVRAAAQMNAANPPPLDADLGPLDDEDDELN